MADGFALNTDLSSALWTPIVAIQLRLAGLGASLVNFQKRVLLLGHKTSAGDAKTNSLVQLTTQDLANRRFGPQSDIACLLAHLQAQLTAMGAAGAEIYGMAVPEPTGGVAAAKLIRFVAQPDSAGLPGVNTGALKAHAATAYLAGWKFTWAIATGDTFANIATNGAAVITAAIQSPSAPSNCPIASAVASGDTITVTVNHAGELGEDFGIRLEFSDDAGGVAASPGTLTITGPATGAGSLTVTAGSLAIPTTVASSATVAAITGNVTTSLRNNPSNVSAINNHANVAGQIILLYASGHVAQRISAATTAAGTGVTAAVGTAGTGVPDLTAALQALRKFKGFRVWVIPWIDTASLSALESHRAEMNNGVIMKDQFFIYGDTRDEVIAGAVPLAPTPKLTTTPWWAGIVVPDAEVRGRDLAAHAAGTIVGHDTPAYNFDYEPLLTTGNVPLGAPHPDVRLDPLTSANTAMVTYHLTPGVVDDETNLFCILRGVTTAQVASDENSNWSVPMCLGYARAFAVNKLRKRFIQPDPGTGGGHLMLKKVGPPQSPNAVRDDAVGDAIKEILDDLEQGTDGSVPDVVDGADDLKRFVKAKYSSTQGGRVDGLFPVRVPVPLHDIALVEQQVL